MKLDGIVGATWVAVVAGAVACSSSPDAPGGAGGRASTDHASTSPSSTASMTASGTGGQGPAIHGACDGIAAGGEDERAVLHAYVDQLQQGCVLPVAGAPAVARVDDVGGVAWIRFGAGELTVPENAQAFVIDLEGAVDGPTLDAFLVRAGAAVLQGDVPGLEATVRLHEGMRDEVYAPIFLGSENLYRDVMRRAPLPAIQGQAAAARPVGVRLGERVSPSAARFALTLRARGRAALIGHGTAAAIAESRWITVRDHGFIHRVTTLGTEAGGLPDVVAADVTGATETEIGTALMAAPAPAPLGGASTRPALRVLPDGDTPPPADADLATRRAALVIAHGAIKLFFPYWGVVPDEADARLDAALARTATDPDTRQALRDTLGFFSHATHDSHGFIIPIPALGGAHRLGLHLERSATDEPVVRLSQVDGISPGDTFVAVDGTPVATTMAAVGELMSSSASSRFRNEADALLSLPFPVTFTLRDPAGATRDVTITGAPTLAPVFPDRARGFLADLGAADLYYVDLSADAFVAADVADAIADVGSSAGVVLDLRGYPDAPAWELLQHLLPTGAPGARMRVEEVSVFGRAWVVSPQPWPSEPAAFTGKVAVLVSPHTQSQAEHLVLTLQSADRVHVIGQPTAGANGNITGVLLPGAFGFLFTGMEVTQPDGSTFHGVGAIPDQLVALDPAALAAGVDPELAAAIAWLSAP